MNVDAVIWEGPSLPHSTPGTTSKWMLLEEKSHFALANYGELVAMQRMAIAHEKDQLFNGYHIFQYNHDPEAEGLIYIDGYRLIFDPEWFDFLSFRRSFPTSLAQYDVKKGRRVTFQEMAKDQNIDHDYGEFE